jgi:hypothetical protein
VADNEAEGEVTSVTSAVFIIDGDGDCWGVSFGDIPSRASAAAAAAARTWALDKTGEADTAGTEGVWALGGASSGFGGCE